MKHLYVLQYLERDNDCFDLDWVAFCYSDSLSVLKNIADEQGFKQWRVLDKKKHILAEFCAL